MRCALLGLE
uniref:Uncharacterized protein n=1 Tax=Anguilla anguilla TaxID=7936 RepID=A0A0E9TPB9_ANGAN